MIKYLFAIPLLSICFIVQADADTPYRGQQNRDIKALSQSDIDGYLSGQGMGFAKAAELNHYPGPRHVLDLANELKLDKSQREQTQALFEKMQSAAIELGKQLLDQEKQLDILFAENRITRESLNSILQEIGLTQARLRYVHLGAHLDQKQILNAHQVMLYDRIRGYSNGSDGNGSQSSGHHNHQQHHSH